MVVGEGKWKNRVHRKLKVTGKCRFGITGQEEQGRDGTGQDVNHDVEHGNTIARATGSKAGVM